MTSTFYGSQERITRSSLYGTPLKTAGQPHEDHLDCNDRFDRACFTCRGAGVRRREEGQDIGAISLRTMSCGAGWRHKFQKSHGAELCKRCNLARYDGPGPTRMAANVSSIHAELHADEQRA